MCCCFKNLIILHLALSLLLIVFREVQLLLIFVEDAEHFLLVFKVSSNLSISSADIF